MSLHNYTPHEINIVLPSGSTTSLPSEGVARVATTPGALGEAIDGVPVAGPDLVGEVTGLPDEAGTNDGDYYIVSAVVGAACKGRPEILVPGTGPNDGCIRKDGRVVAITRLKRV